MHRRILILIFLYSVITYAQQINYPQLSFNKTNKCFFIQNKGQWDPEVKYLARLGGMNAWITNSGVVYDYYRVNKNLDEPKTNGNRLLNKMMNPKAMLDLENKNTTIEGNIVRMGLVNSEKEVSSVGNDRQEGYYNYFIGNDQTKWASFVPLYESVEIKGVYKNIDVKYYYDNGMLRYDYIAKPGADISQIKFKFEGQQGISINSNGELVLKTNIGDVTNGKVYAYQLEGGTQKEVECKFEQTEDGIIGLKTENYDAGKGLIIDPLVYSTFIGVSNSRTNSIAIDTKGNGYITGWTSSSNYPITNGAYQTTIQGSSDAFVTKLNSSGSALVYSTFVGGNVRESGYSIAIDESGNAYIAGVTESSNFPTTNGAYQTNFGNNREDAFITKLNSTGSALIFSTYISGGSSGNSPFYVNSIAIDAGFNTYITGGTASSNFPVTPGAFQTTLGNNWSNVFITKLNSTGSNLIYSTYLSGSGKDINPRNGNGDFGYSIAVDANGNAYITGYAYSSNYPTTPGAYQTNLIGPSNVIVSKLNSTGSALVYSTYIGGKGDEYGSSIAVDASGNAYITGEANPSSYPTIPGAYQDSSGGSVDAFITKLNSTGSALVYSTYIGGNEFDGAESIAIDASGNAYISGQTSSDNYPTTVGAYQNTKKGESNNAFVTKLNSSGSALVYSTFLGTSSDAYSIASDASGKIYILGSTASSDYPITSGAYQTTMQDSLGADFVTKIDLSTVEDVESKSSYVPNKYELSQNYPNPFNPSTIIKYALPFSSKVNIAVYNILGERVRELLNEQKNAGYYELNFNTNGLASGVYLYLLKAKSTDGKSEFRDTKKMVLLK